MVASDRDALLKAILANPEEDTPRLMYADEIEDEEPERAEFIRVQVELSKCDSPNGYCNCGNEACRWCPLYWRQQELLTTRHPIHTYSYLADHWFSGLGVVVTHGAAGPCWWYPPAPHGSTGFPFAIERGFVSWLELPADVWITHGDAIRALHPISLVRLTTLPEYYEHAHEPDESGVMYLHVLTDCASDDNAYGIWGRRREFDINMVVALLNRRWPGITFELP